ncbi:MAG: DUF4349 domain-containing protein [Acetatifactor sp.]|nr:DUF4349 domain-containing protein [Acetatifactor sp.]
MKKRNLWKGLAKTLACLCAVSMLAACGAEGYNKSADASYERGYAESVASYSNMEKGGESYGDEELWSENGGNSSGGSTQIDPEHSSTTAQATKRKLIKNVSMNVETQEYNTLMANLEARVKELGGYVQNMESYNGSSYSRNSYVRHANLTVRIPQNKLDEFVNSVSELGNVTSRSENVEDVTLQYVDVKSHKESLQVEQQRLLELLERATNLEDIITLENRLSTVRYQIESMESTLRTYDDLVDYSTVRLTINEVEVYTPVVEEKESNWQRMTRGFMESLVSVGNGLLNFGIWFVIKLPYIVVWAIVITLIVVLIKILRKNKKNKKENGEKAEKKTRKFGKPKAAEEEAKENAAEETPVYFGNNKPEEKK